MEYTQDFERFRALFSDENEEITIPGSDIKICNVNFRSDIPQSEFMNASDKFIAENSIFSYPVFVPRIPGNRKVILLFHGLNERSWLKYLSWAFSLVEHTGSYVILFPISFHINRSPASWRDPRSMAKLLKDRNTTLGETEMSSFANYALSNRLMEDPFRFFKSGYQTVEDVIKLVCSIKSGMHPVVPATSDINIFAYSIGAFLAEIIMIGNPENLFSESRLFIFCGGSVFSNMKGTSKFIMDRRAFDMVYHFYLDDFERNITGQNRLTDFLNANPLGLAFRSMIDLDRFRTFRENALKRISSQISAITLAKDYIIPPGGIFSTLVKIIGKNNLRIWDFPFSYSHENPFPVLKSPLARKVDYWFDRLFAEAALFLA